MVTVFTPIYNRKDTMNRLYESLCRQSDKRFEWLIVDDGSTDSVDVLITKWINECNDFSIRYYRQENGGKHRAINKGVILAYYEAFFIVDSDDYLTDDAIEFINSKFYEIEKDDKFAGISGLKKSYKDNRIMGGSPLIDCYVDATNLERNKYGLLGDKAEVYKTNILKKYPFPEFEGENFLGEGIVWDHIAIDGYMLRWFNYPLYMCEYLNDGLTRNSFDVYKKNPKGWANYLVNRRKWGLLSYQQFDKEYFNYYERMQGELSEQEIQFLLQLNNNEMDYFKNKWMDNLKKIETFICQNKLKTISFYGVGICARRLLQYFLKIDIKIEYLIDKYCQSQNIGYKIYSFEDAFPNVDCICISLAVIPEGLITQIKQKAPFAKVVFWQEIGVCL